MLRHLALVVTLILASACGERSAIDMAQAGAVNGVSANTTAQNAAREFPLTPRDEETPGSVCTSNASHRYPENIRYCARDVSSETKRDIIRTYDRKFGYSIGRLNRSDFKIDHLIPLCMGGSNERNNLWPQHKSVYAITDPMEPELCELMARGCVTQAWAKEKILFLKHNLASAPDIQEAIRQKMALGVCSRSTHE